MQRDVNMYEVKVGFSVLDLGGVSFDKDPDSYDREMTLDVNSWDLTNVQLSSIQDFDDTLNTRFPMIAAGNEETYFMNLPLAISAQVDWNIDYGFYLGASAFLSPTGTDVNKVGHLTRATLNPRYESKWFGAGVPLSYQAYSGFDAGLYLRLGPLVVGSHNLFKTLFADNVSGYNLWFAFKVPIPYGKTYGPSDRDGDGVYDQNDECIDVPGPVVNNGCPYGDLDQDGVLDNADECIDTPGPIKNNGCPYGDKDGDGVLDEADACIDVAGPADNNGCPYLDTDGDGVLDKDDECLLSPGTVENNGCPALDEEQEEVLRQAFENLEFDVNKDIIRESSFASLNELAKLLVENPTWVLSMEGHTDSDGADADNLDLSKRRVESVKRYLVERGADGEQFRLAWFGESDPLVPNDSPENKQKNRRVEMTIIFN